MPVTALPAIVRCLLVALLGLADAAQAQVGLADQQAQWNAHLPPAEVERRLYAAVTDLRDVAPSAEARRWLESLLNHPVVATRPLADRPHLLRVPLYPVAKAAQATLEIWAASEALVALDDALARGAAKAAFEADPPVLARWIRQADPVRLGAVAASLLAAPAVDEAVLIALAERLPDSAARDRLAASATSAPALRSLQRIAGTLDDTQRLQLWRLATRNRALASAAWLALGELATDQELAVTELRGALDDPEHGASAAVALARAGVLDANAWARRLADGPDPLTRRHAALALLALDDPAARQALRLAAADPAIPAGLRAELSRWLR